MTFLFIPLIFYGLSFWKDKKNFLEFPKTILIGAIGIAGVILSHALIFVLLLPVIIIYLTASLFLTVEKLRKKKVLSDLLIFILGFGLSAFYLIPAFYLKKNTFFEKIMAGTSMGFADHFPSFKQLIYSRWGYGFSFSGVAGDAMSFQVGITQWLVVGLAILMIIAWSAGKLKMKTKSKNNLVLAVIFLSIFAFSISMMLEFSKPIWQLVNKFAYIDFPWRYLLISTFASSVLAGFVIWATGGEEKMLGRLGREKVGGLGVFLAGTGRAGGEDSFSTDPAGENSNSY